ncbi:hypothetical protein IAU60_006858 [Kwoniella sp. DSM 27419]
MRRGDVASNASSESRGETGSLPLDPNAPYVTSNRPSRSEDHSSLLVLRSRSSLSLSFAPLQGRTNPDLHTMQRRYQNTSAYPSPDSSRASSPTPDVFNSKVFQAEERMISRELKIKHQGHGKFIRIVEMSCRDGLQNLPGPPVPTEVKRELVERLLAAGLRNIEVGSFVRGDWIPQMADTAKLLPTLPALTGQSLPVLSPPSSRSPSPNPLSGPLEDPGLIPTAANEVHFPVLVPNMRGLDNLLKLQADWSGRGGGRLTDEIAVFVSATDAFSQANNHAPRDKVLASLPPVIAKAQSAGYRVRGYVSCVITDPYSGPTAWTEVVEVTKQLLAMGCYEVSLGDTTGEGDPESWRRIWQALDAAGVDAGRIACHDTFSLALSSLCSMLPEGLSSIDSSLAGLGGCPYSPGATGNVPTEDVVYTLHKLGYETGIDLDKLVEAGDWLSSTLGVRNESRVGRAIWARRASRERLSAPSSGTDRQGSKGEDAEDST